MLRLNVHDASQVFPAQAVEHDDLIHPVQELRPEVLTECLQHLVPRCLHPMFNDVVTADIAGHDHHCVLEVHGSPVPVSQPAIIQQLEQHVEYLRMRFFDLIEENHAIGLPPDCLSQLAAFLIPDIARWRAESAELLCGVPDTRSCQCGRCCSRHRTGIQPGHEPALFCRRRSAPGR